MSPYGPAALQNRDGVLSIEEAVHGFEELAKPLGFRTDLSGLGLKPSPG